MELLVHEGRQLGGVIVEVARVEGEHRNGCAGSRQTGLGHPP
jgi:hypothetical protein